MNRLILTILSRSYCKRVPRPLRSRKLKSASVQAQNFVDYKDFRALGGKGGDGCISFLSVFCKEFAGPDGGDGGNGGHVILKANANLNDLKNIHTVLKAHDGEKGGHKDCDGQSASHLIVEVPVGTVIKKEGKVVGDLSKDSMMFVAARGGAGGKGNHYFTTDTEQCPQIAEYGAEGESLEYSIEIRSMAHIGLIGFPNAGKSTLLRAISRARPKVAPYPFTTLQPHIGIVQYDDYEQLAVADLPGLIPDSHKNRGLGIQFLRHAERCSGLLFILDASSDTCLDELEILRYELHEFSSELIERPQLIVANKMDLPNAEKNFHLLRSSNTNIKVLPLSAKLGTNLTELLEELRKIYDASKGSETSI